jgi:anti-sigma regulatory factor (Ser/Thr protein kinase)
MAPEQSVEPGERRPDDLLRIPSRQFEPTVQSVAAVRRMVDTCLAHVTPACRDAVSLIASEFASNAVVHARTPYVVELRIDEVVRIEVTDNAPGGPVLRRVPRDAESGRGLALVANFSTQWGVDWLDGCKVAWAEVDLDQ